MNNRLEEAPSVFEGSLRKRLHQAQYYHYSKMKKRKHMKGAHNNALLHEEYEKRLKVPMDNKGSVEDLEHAAAYLNFSYVLIGLDANFNWFWKEVITTSSKEKTETPRKLCFFLYITKSKIPFWHYLVDAEWDVPKVQGIYENKTFKDDTRERRMLYWTRKSLHGKCGNITHHGV
jgi:hypothetical protein